MYEDYDYYDYSDDGSYYDNGAVIEYGTSDYGGGGFDYGAGGDFYYGYGFDTGAEYGDSGYSSGGNESDLFGAYYDFYLGMGLDPAQAAGFAAEDASAGSFEIPTLEQGLLPDVSFPFYGLPYIPDPFLTPYNPVFYELPVPPAPQQPLPTSPSTQQPNLPPACPGGTYHPYPIGHPDQNKCVPFPPAQTGPSQQQKPPAPQQQKCPTGYYLDPVTRQCKPIPRCTTPGTVFDQARGICVPKTQAVSPLPEGAGGLFDELKKLPWWIWLALGGLLLLGKSDDGRTTTVRYRRAS
jgi:hypothetical protein